MKVSYLTTLLAFFTIGTPIFLNAQRLENKKERKIALRPTSPPIGKKPRMPAREVAECWYGDGELYVEFYTPEGECDITVTDTTTGFTITDTFDSVMPYTLYIGTPASATITIVTEAENIYYGEIQ